MKLKLYQDEINHEIQIENQVKFNQKFRLWSEPSSVIFIRIFLIRAETFD